MAPPTDNIVAGQVVALGERQVDLMSRYERVFRELQKNYRALLAALEKEDEAKIKRVRPALDRAMGQIAKLSHLASKNGKN